MTKLLTRQEEIRISKKKMALGKNYLLFWDSNIFWRCIYHLILKHKFQPMDVLHRYEMRAERKIIKLIFDKNH